jgi:hypothetical protein
MWPVWLIEAGVYGEGAERLRAAVLRRGLACDRTRFWELTQRAPVLVDGRPLDEDACVVFYGSFPCAALIQARHGWAPGAWCSFRDLRCGAYYPHFRGFLLNEPSQLLNGLEVLMDAGRLFDAFGRDGRVFIRPDSCEKLLTGRCVARADLAAALAPTRYNSQTLVVVARPREIGREWRLVIAGDRVAGASQYRDRGKT